MPHLELLVECQVVVDGNVEIVEHRRIVAAQAFGEQVADMIHPMWAMPMVAIAGIGVQRVLGFTTLACLVGLVLYGASLLLLV